jgi:hypothetical protein
MDTITVKTQSCRLCSGCENYLRSEIAWRDELIKNLRAEIQRIDSSHGL